MKYVPKGLTRVASRSLLKLNANSPTILVVAGVVGFGATTALAVKATRKIDPVLENHQKSRNDLSHIAYSSKRVQQQDLLALYTTTGVRLGKIYAPTIVVGTLSTVSILAGHKILRGRHLATVAAYSGLMDQFNSYRGRVAKTLGEPAELDIYRGAHGEYVEDPDHKGEYKLQPQYKDLPPSYLTPWFDQTNVNWNPDPIRNYLFLKGVQQHMNNLLQIRGHVFLNEVLDALALPRHPEGQVAGWVHGNKEGDGVIDFGFFTGRDPQTVAFRDHETPTVRLNFNIEGYVLDLI